MHSILKAILEAMSPVEIVAAITSLFCVYLTVRNNIWNWLWGFIGVILYGYVFYVQGLYANAALQIIYYLPIQFIGWYVWLRTGPTKNDDLPITMLSVRARLICVGVTVALTLLLYWLFKDGLTLLFPKLPPDPQPFIDGLTTAVSIVAQYLQVPKKFENWTLWIGVDIVYIYLFLAQPKPLYVSAVLYAIFTCLAVKGAIDWLRLYRKQEAAKQERRSTSAEIPLS